MNQEKTATVKLNIQEQTHKSYTFGSFSLLDEATLDMLIDMFRSGTDEQTESLAGRVAPRFVSIPAAGPVVVKFYKRGGWLSRVNRERYFRTFKTRPRKEFEFLIHAANAGVNVPVPVTFASHGFLCYRAWLVTREIPEHVSFMRLCTNEKEKAISLLPEISRHIRLLINSGIHHVDLHPGNIIVEKDDNPYFIDFDRARYCSAAGSKLAEKYQRRWTRAIRKYNLPEVLSDLRLTAENRND